MTALKKYTIIILLLMAIRPAFIQAQEPAIRKAPAPLFRDPITDGAADPVVFYNPIEKEWWMLYTQRRANIDLPDVAYCYGNAIGVAASSDNGKTWIYRGALDLEFERGHNTFWAPDIVFHNGQWHLFVAYIIGVRNHWGGGARMAHYTSKNLWDWKFSDFSNLGFESVIDGSLIKLKNGDWRMYFKGPNAHTYMADSRNLKKWKTNTEVVIGGKEHEGANVFEFAGHFWMLTDEWSGMRVYKSSDMKTWEKQGMILDDIGTRPDDRPTGAHGDAVVAGDKAYVFYFTHPGRKTHFAATLDANGMYPYQERRSSIEVAQLVYEDGTLRCIRNEDFDFYLGDPDLTD